MDISLMFRCVQDYATRNGYIGGLPTFLDAVYHGKVYGAVMLPASTAEFRDVPNSDMPVPPGADFGTRMRAAQDYATTQKGFVGAIPTFNEATYNGVLVHGLLLKAGPGAMARRRCRRPRQSSGWRRWATLSSDTDLRHSTAHGGQFPQLLSGATPGSAWRPDQFYGTLLFRARTAEWRDVHAGYLGAGPLDDPAERMLRLQLFAAHNGFVGAFANFVEADYGPSGVYGSFLVRAPGAQWRDVSLKDLGNPTDGDYGALFRAAQTYATAQGLPGAFPTSITPTGMGPWHGAARFDHGRAARVPVVAFGPVDTNDGPGRFRATQQYAASNGAKGGFPNFFETTYPATGKANGTILLKGGVDFHDIPFADLFTGAYVGGAIRAKWIQLGGSTGFLGAPLTVELPCADRVGRYNLFEGGVIYWTPAHGAFAVHGGILDAWNST